MANTCKWISPEKVAQDVAVTEQAIAPSCLLWWMAIIVLKRPTFSNIDNQPASCPLESTMEIALQISAKLQPYLITGILNTAVCQKNGIQHARTRNCNILCAWESVWPTGHPRRGVCGGLIYATGFVMWDAMEKLGAASNTEIPQWTSTVLSTFHEYVVIWDDS
jgi:hypothetical protein